MPKEHKVKQGECISSIAEKYGLFPETIWDDAANAKLKETRKDLNVLYMGDVVVIPDKRDKEESGATEQRHRFIRKDVPNYLRIIVTDEDDEPLTDTPYLLTIDHEHRQNITDSEGLIEEPIPPNARKGKLLVGENEDIYEYDLDLGHLDPIDEITGVQARLNNLGFECGETDGILGSRTEGALAKFQKMNGLSQTGTIDDQTRNKLVEVHGS